MHSGLVISFLSLDLLLLLLYLGKFENALVTFCFTVLHIHKPCVLFFGNLKWVVHSAGMSSSIGVSFVLIALRCDNPSAA